MDKIEEIISNLGLKPHPEGGYFRETYRSVGVISQECLGMRYNSLRNYSTCIYFLLTSGRFSAFHRIVQDEIWHFYKGSSLKIHMIDDKGVYSVKVVGTDFEKGEVPQFVVSGQTWFAATVSDIDSYSLVGCTVSPGFDFEDFELPDRQELTLAFPQHKEIIKVLTR
jgi:uncharacterized protein